MSQDMFFHWLVMEKVMLVSGKHSFKGQICFPDQFMEELYINRGQLSKHWPASSYPTGM